MPPHPETVDQYIESQAPETHGMLRAVREAVLAAVPGGEERISYRMPAVFAQGVVIYYAAFKKHLGVYPPVADPKLKAKTARYAGPKGNLQFPYAEPIPYALIAEVARARWKANVAAAQTKAAAQARPKAARAR